MYKASGRVVSVHSITIIFLVSPARLFMLLVWAGTIAGVVLIFLDIGGWPYSLMFIMTNPHPVLGLAALALTFIQPFIALCRPHQASPLRWIFNWCHWFVGNCAQVGEVLTQAVLRTVT